jgi:hypothetical protein
MLRSAKRGHTGSTLNLGLVLPVILGIITGQPITAQQTPEIRVSIESVHITRGAQAFLERESMSPALLEAKGQKVIMSQPADADVWLELVIAVNTSTARTLLQSGIVFRDDGNKSAVTCSLEQAVFTPQHPIHRGLERLWQSDRPAIMIPAGESRFRVLFAVRAEALQSGTVEIVGAAPVRIATTAG